MRIKEVFIDRSEEERRKIITEALVKIENNRTQMKSYISFMREIKD